MSINQMVIVRRRVCRVSADGLKDMYQVYEQESNGNWFHVSKPYPHSTSAFAALGRLVQKDTTKD